MKKNKENPLTDWNGFFDELQNETPRAAVIIAGAFLEAQLRAILSNAFIDDPKIVNELLGSEAFTFSTKIKTAYCMGLISKDIYHDLNVIRDIRNKFAHNMHGYSFDEPEIVDRCKNLKLANMIAGIHPDISHPHGELFLLGVSQLASFLGLKIVESENSHKSVPDDPRIGQVIKL